MAPFVALEGPSTKDEGNRERRVNGESLLQKYLQSTIMRTNLYLKSAVEVRQD